MAEVEEQIPQTEEPTETKEAEVQEPKEENTEPQSENGTEEPQYIRDPILDEEEMRKIFVGGIVPESTDEELKAFFEEVSGGTVTDQVIIKKENQEKKNHFGFITFETSELVDEVLLKREQLKFKDKQLDVNRAVPKSNQNQGAHEKTKKLFIANLPKLNCSGDDLMKYFLQRHPKKYGTIEKLNLIKKKDSEENKGFGFIIVSSEDMADKMAIQHSTFEFGGRKIELKKSVPTQREGGNRGRKGNQMYGGGPQQGYGGYGYGYGYPGAWGEYPYGAGYGGGYDYGYGAYGGQAPRGRGGRGGGNRYTPY